MVLAVAAAVVALVCIRLGIWQLDRLEERRAVNAEVSAALASEPIPLDAVLAEDADPAYRRVVASGTWDPASEVILFGRSLDGRPGNHVLTPLELGDGRAVLVDRGWVPADVADPPVTGDAAAAGTATVEGILLPSDAGGTGEPSDGSALPEQVRTIDVAALDPAIPLDLVPDVYLLRARQEPAQDRPVPAPLPALTEGPHLGYAIQWFTFAAVALVGGVVLVRRDRRAGRLDSGKDHPLAHHSGHPLERS